MDDETKGLLAGLAVILGVCPPQDGVKCPEIILMRALTLHDDLQRALGRIADLEMRARNPL